MAAQGDDCYFYYYSTCTKGDSCQFRHCPEALGNEIVCSLWREGRCQRIICNYRHMEINKNRSMIQCYWESQPSGCLKQHCPFRHVKPRGVDPSQTSSPTKPGADIRNALVSSGSVPVKKVIPAPVVELVVVTPESESDETSSTEVSPVKKIKFPSSSLLSSVKEDAFNSTSDAGQLNFGIKTLSEIRQNSARDSSSLQNTVTDGQPGDLRKIVSLKGKSSAQTEGDKLSSMVQSGVVSQKIGESGLANTRKRITFKTGDETSVITRRKLISSENEGKPTRISLNPNSGKNDNIKGNTSSGIKSLAQIRQERLLKNIQVRRSDVSEQGDGGIKTLEQIRRERKVRVGMKIDEDGDAITGRIENLEAGKLFKNESTVSAAGDLGIKSLEEIRKEQSEKLAVGGGEKDESGVKSLEQIRRERIANRLGLRTESEKDVISSSDEPDSEGAVEKETFRTSVVRRLGGDVTVNKNTIHARLGSGAKIDNPSEVGRKIQLKDSGEIQFSQEDSQVLSRKVVKVRPAVSNSQEEESAVKPKRRRVTLMGGSVDKNKKVTEVEEEDGEVKLGLSKSGIRVGRLAMDCAEEENRKRRVSEDSDEVGNDVKEEPKKKRILIRRNEDRLKNPVKRRADRQIYQPPAAKSKERVSSVKTRLGQKAVSETEKDNQEQKDEKDETEEEVSVKKRPRITFHTDATSKQMDSEKNSEEQAKNRLSNIEGINIKSGIVRIKPVSESPATESEHSEPQPPKKKRGGGLRERLLKQSEKFTVGVAGGKLESASEKVVASDEEKNVWSPVIVSQEVEDGNARRESSSREANVELPEESIVRGQTQEAGDDRTDLVLEEREQTIVSSSGGGDMSGGKVESTEKRIPDVGGLVDLPDTPALSTTSEQISFNSGDEILPDSTNQIIPSVAIAQPKTIPPMPSIESSTSKPGAGSGKAQKTSNGRSSKPRISITDDDLADLLDDVDGDDQPDQYEDDDDALLNELEDLINA